jgi:hypothetical protein
MKKLSLTLFIFILFQNVYAQTAEQSHQQAIHEIKNLHFFYDGKGMSISPDLIKFYDLYKMIFKTIDNKSALNQRWGLNLVNNNIVGLFEVPYKKMNIGVLGCVACHSGKAAGEFIVGLGNKTIDVGQIGKDVYRVQKMWSLYPGDLKSPEFRSLHQQSLKFTKKLSNPEITNLTQGLVPTSLIRTWFFEQANEKVPENFPRGQVKVPHLWGYGLKRQSGSFWDGEGKGVLPGWAVAVELFAGQTAENVRAYEEKIHHAEDLFSYLLPPKYPFKIDSDKVVKGKKLFTQNCQGCHGQYQQTIDGISVFDFPKAIPVRVVKTDDDRLKALTPKLYELISSNPLNDLIQFQKQPEPSYVAPRLEGIWARFPYLHNASVPTVYELISAPDQRTKRFSLKNAGEKEKFDEIHLGLRVDEPLSKKSSRQIYNTSIPGQSNSGHFFPFMEKLSHENKIEIIEYLKTL